MDTRYDFPQWSFYRSLEKDLEDCFEYVNPTIEHFEVHSNRFARIILLACIEIENALIAFGPPAKSSVIKQYFSLVTAKFPNFSQHEFIIPQYEIRSQPWKAWSKDVVPLWWSQGYNKIKHARISNPQSATMKNAIDALCGLQCVLLHVYRNEYGKWNMPMEMAPALIWPLHPQHGRIWRAMMVWDPPLADDLPDLP